MSHGFAFALLIRSQEQLTSIRLHFNFTRGLHREVVGHHLLQVDERQYESVGERSPEFFRQVQGQTGSAWSLNVKKAYVRVEPHAFQSRAHVERQY